MDTVIITTDFSVSATHAAEYGAAFARWMDVHSIILYHSSDQGLVATEIPVPESVHDTAAHEKHIASLTLLENHIRPFAGVDIHVELVANEQPLLLGIEQLAERRKASLVVAGTTGKSGLEKLVMGSNAISLVKACPLPLLIVPHEARFVPIRKMVYACDLQKVGRSTPVSLLRFFMERLQAELLVLNVSMEGKRFDPDVIPEQYKLHSLLDSLNPEYHYTEEDDIAEGIMDFAAREGAGLVVTVPKSYGFFERLFHRSVTKELVSHTELPLLVLRELE